MKKRLPGFGKLPWEGSGRHLLAQSIGGGIHGIDNAVDNAIGDAIDNAIGKKRLDKCDDLLHRT